MMAAQLDDNDRWGFSLYTSSDPQLWNEALNPTVCCSCKRSLTFQILIQQQSNRTSIIGGTATRPSCIRLSICRGC